MPKNDTETRSSINSATSNVAKDIKNTKSPQSPRAPPLISKYRGESPPPLQKKLERPHTANEGTFFSSIGRSNRPSFYIIHPEWSSEAEGISRLDSRTNNTIPCRGSGRTVGRRTPRDTQNGTSSDGEIHGGILPMDRGDESILTTARRAATHNPVWPHRCKSSPAQRSRNPIAWV